LQIWGLVRSSDPVEPVCHPSGVPAGGTSIITAVQVQREGTAWIATSQPGAGTVQLRFSQTGNVTPQGEPVTGTIRGVARDATVGAYRVATNVSVTFGGLRHHAVVQGIASPATAFIWGTLTGRFAFSDPFGATSTCRLLYWTLQPVAGALPALAVRPPPPVHLRP
jgi:hypothetical protein